MVRGNAILHNLPVFQTQTAKSRAAGRKVKKIIFMHPHPKVPVTLKFQQRRVTWPTTASTKFPPRTQKATLLTHQQARYTFQFLWFIMEEGGTLANNLWNFKIYKRFYLDALYNQNVKLFQLKSFTSAPQLKVTPPSL